MSTVKRFILLSFILSGCFDDTPASSQHVADLETDVIEFYHGESTLFSGNWSEKTTYLIRRSLYPSENRLTEELWNTDNGEFYLVDMDVDVESAELTLVFEPQGWVGEGALTGDAWSWTGWETTTVIPKGDGLEAQTVVSVDVLTAESLTVFKEATLTDGSLYWEAEETFFVIDEVAFDAELALLEG